jgi:hypothetical protein
VKRRRSWFRRLGTLVICLLLGVVLTVWVAWTAMLVPAAHSKRAGAWTAISSRRGTAIASSQHLGATRTMRMVRLSVQGEVTYSTDIWSGWPADAMGYTLEFGAAPYAVRGALTPPHRLIPKDGLVRDSHLLPLVPLWPGFVIDTLVYTALCWLLFFSPFTLRRIIRIRRGRCPACGYDMRGLDACPECGDEA